MYSGTTLTKISGNIMGAHQKIDRLARKHLEELIPGLEFPPISEILHFEGDNGPDGIKRKSPAKDEPWHFILPFDKTDTQLIDIISSHFNGLVKALKDTNEARAAFEAAWLAHSVVDGLTPPHHYPYNEKLIELQNGEGNEGRTTIKKKLVLPGDNRSEAIKNNWKMWGPKGLLTTHVAFELGFATLISPLSFADMEPATKFIGQLKKVTLGTWFRRVAQSIAKLDLYSQYYEDGWTRKLSLQARQELAPTIINAVTAVWYMAYEEANQDKKS